MNDTEEVIANLEPALGDVDLGNSTGLQFTPMAVGGTQTVTVRVNAQTASLRSFLVSADPYPSCAELIL